MTTGFSRYRYAGRLALMCAFAAWTPHVAGESLPAISTGARLAANCAACHGTSGITEGIALPSLAGQGKGVLLVALKAFKSGARQGTIMPQIAKGYTEEQLALLAEYFAAQPTVPTAALPVTPDRITAGADVRPRDMAVAVPVAAPARPPERMALTAATPVSRIAVTGWPQDRSASAASSPIQPVLQAVLQPVPHPGQQPVPRAEPQVVQSPAQQPAQLPAHQLVQQPVQQPALEPVAPPTLRVAVQAQTP